MFVFYIFLKTAPQSPTVGSRTQTRGRQLPDTGWWDGPLVITHLITRQKAAARTRLKADHDSKRIGSIFLFCLCQPPRQTAPWQEDPRLTATTMSQRFTVSKSDGDRRPSDIQGEVNQLFEGDEPPSSSGGAEGEAAGGTEVVVVLKGRQSVTGFIHPVWLATSYMLAVMMLDSCLVTLHCLWTDVCDLNF